MVVLAFRPARRDERKARPRVPLPLIIEDQKKRDEHDHPGVYLPIPQAPMEEPPMLNRKTEKPKRGAEIIDWDRDDSGWVDFSI